MVGRLFAALSALPHDTARQFGAAGALLIVAACLTVEFQSPRPRWMAAILGFAVALGAASLTFGLIGLQGPAA